MPERSFYVVVFVMVGLVAACGSDTNGAGSGGSSSTTTATTGAGGGGTGGCDGSGGVGFALEPAWTSCNGPGQCTLRGASCCEGCGDVPIESLLAIRMDAHEVVTDAACTFECKEHGDCPAIGCQAFTSYNVAVCRSGSCLGVDIRDDELTACSTDADCTLRWGVGCCELCSTGPDETGLVAVRKTPSLSEALCNPETPCPPCVAPPYPQNASAVCNDAGHCEVKLAP